MPGLNFRNINCSEFDMFVARENLFQDNLFADFNDVTDTVDSSDITHYFGTSFRPRSRSFTFLVDDVDENTYRAIQKWLNPKELGVLYLDVTPYKHYICKVAKAPDFRYIQYYDSDSGCYRYNGTATVEFIAFDPFAKSFFNTLDEFTYDAGKFFYDSGILYAEYTPPTSFQNITSNKNLILYNGGNHRSPCVVRVRGMWNSLKVSNKTTNQEFTLKSPLEATTFYIDAEYGRVLVGEEPHQVLASSFHDGSYIEVEGNGRLQHYKDVHFEDNIAILNGQKWSADIVGRFLFIEGNQFKVLEKTDDNTLLLDKSYNGINDVVVVDANEIEIRGSNINIQFIEFIYKYTYM